MGLPVLPLILVAALQIPPPPPPPPNPGVPIVPRDPTRPVEAVKGTAAIRGLVTDQDTGRPLARATVTLMGGAARTPDGRPVQARTDGQGRFEFTALPAGRYTLAAEPGEFRATHLRQTYGDTRPFDPSRPGRGTPVPLGDGEIREDINIALRRAFAIEGRVVDEFGEPLAGIELITKLPETGQRPMMMGNFFGARSDDRGYFRLFGLGPGRYLVCANPRNFGSPMLGEVKERAIQTCHPSAVVEAEAQPVTVSTADLGGVDIRIQRSRAFSASGIALDSSGAPLERAQVMVVRTEGETGSSSTGVEMRPGGQFIARGLTPGDYAIRAEIGNRFNSEDKREREIGYVPFRIDSSDVDGLVVTTSKPTTVAGRVVFEDQASAPTATGMRVTVMPDRGSRMMTMGPPPTAQVNADLTFDLSGLFGPSGIALMGAPRDWFVKSTRYKGQDITDQFVDFASHRSGDSLEIVLGNRGALVTGRVLDAAGNLPSDVQVMLLTADQTRWKATSTGGGPMRGATPKPDGAFELRAIRPGEYFLVAVGFDDMPRGPSDPAYFERLARAGQRISLSESEQQTIELRVTKLQ